MPNFWVEKTIVKGNPDRQTDEHGLGNALWSPQKDKRGADIYADMREVQEGDIVLHLIDNDSIVGISKAASKYDDNFTCPEGTKWGGRPGYIIKLKDYVEFDKPIPRDKILNDYYKDRLLKIKEGNKVFYNSKLELNQGSYLTKAPLELVQIINEVHKILNGDGLPYFDDKYIKIPDEILYKIKKLYIEFKQSSDYEFRLNQRQFVDKVAHPVLGKLVEKEKLGNNDLIALMQILNVKSQEESFINKLKSLGFEEAFTNDIIQEFQKLASDGYKAYTWPGIANYQYNDEQLSTVLEFLRNVYDTDSKDEIENIVEDFNSKNVPKLKHGSYSPLLHYMHPDKCPILNEPVESFLNKLGWDEKHGYIVAWNMLKQIKQAVDEKDYGLIDMFINSVSFDNLSNDSIVDDPFVNLVSKKKQAILYGPPGTGKTYNTKDLAVKVVENG